MTLANSIVDLRSDTVTLPTEAMLERMRSAPLGDDSRDGDPTVIELEERAARMTGKQAGLFVASGTMGNLLALLAHCIRGGDLLSDADAHVVNTELSSVSMVAGLLPLTVPSKRGVMDIDGLDETIRASLASSRPGPAIIWMETSHNGAGGTVLPLDHMGKVQALGKANGLPVHIDGARLFNAAKALGVPASSIAGHADSAMFCLSKGLSAPVGSMLVGAEDFIARARKLRRVLGGNMRQAGVLAAAGLVALETMTDRLGEDHRSASLLAQGLSWLDPALANPAPTNILRIDVSGSGLDAAGWGAALNEHGIRPQVAGKQQLRLVTHRHIDSEAVDRTIAAFKAVGERLTPAQAAR